MNLFLLQPVQRLCLVPALSYLRKQCISTNLKHFTPIYQFPYIRGIGLINRLKVYQTAISIFVVPASIVLWESDMVTSEVVVAALGLSISGCMLFYSLGIFANKLIGNVYIHKDKDKVRIAYLNFWGKRQDRILGINDITPYRENRFPVLQENLYKKYVTIPDDEILKLNVKYGKVLDNEMFNKVFED